MVEYLLVAAIALVLVAVPYEGKASVLAFLLDAIHTAWARFLGALSVPQ